MHRNSTGLKSQHNPWLSLPTADRLKNLLCCKGLWAALEGAGIFVPLTWQWGPCHIDTLIEFVLSRSWRTSVLCQLLFYLLRFSTYLLVNLIISHWWRMGLIGASVHPQGHRDAVIALGMSTPPEGLQCRAPLVMLVHAAHHSPEVCGGSGSGRSRAELCSLPFASLHRHPGLSAPPTWLLWGFISPETWLMSLCSSVGEHSPLCQGVVCMELGLPEKLMHKEWLSCLCPKVPFPFADRGVISDRNRLWGEQEPDVDPAEAAAAWHGPVPGGAAHLHPGATLVP